VLSGNRNFEGRVNPHTRANYLASPPLCVAYALAGNIKVDLINDPIGTGGDGQPVYLKDIWPSNHEIAETIQASLTPEMFRQRYSNVFAGPPEWQSIETATGQTYKWTEGSTYVKLPPLFEDMMARAGAGLRRSRRPSARHPGRLDHDRPHLPGRFDQEEQPGRRISDGLSGPPGDFNSYGARRGNHEVMMRGTFANIRIKNEMVPGVEGGITKHIPSGEVLPIYTAAMRLCR
jgi:aconitate hydratase